MGVQDYLARAKSVHCFFFNLATQRVNLLTANTLLSNPTIITWY